MWLSVATVLVESWLVWNKTSECKTEKKRPQSPRWTQDPENVILKTKTNFKYDNTHKSDEEDPYQPLVVCTLKAGNRMW